MKEKEIIETIKSLARSQGFYGRLYQQLMDAKEANSDAYQGFIEDLEAQNFSDAVDLVLYLEA